MSREEVVLRVAKWKWSHVGHIMYLRGLFHFCECGLRFDVVKKSTIQGIIVYDRFKWGLACVPDAQNIFPTSFPIGVATASENFLILS